MPIPLEDNVGDIVGKAQRGLRVSDSQLAEKAGVRVEALDQLRGGQVDNDMLRKVAPILKLDSKELFVPIDIASYVSTTTLDERIATPELNRFVGGGPHVLGEHDARIQRRHVGLDDVGDHASGEDGRTAAGVAAAHLAERQREAIRDVGAHEQRAGS